MKLQSCFSWGSFSVLWGRVAWHPVLCTQPTQEMLLQLRFLGFSRAFQDRLLILRNMFLGYQSLCKSPLQGTASLHQVRFTQTKTVHNIAQMMKRESHMTPIIQVHRWETWIPQLQLATSDLNVFINTANKGEKLSEPKITHSLLTDI